MFGVLTAFAVSGAAAGTGVGCAGAAGCAPTAFARDGSTNDAVVSAAVSLPCITATAPTPTKRPHARSAMAHDVAGRPATLWPDVTAVPGGSEYGACGVMKCAGTEADIATPGTLTGALGTGP